MAASECTQRADCTERQHSAGIAFLIIPDKRFTLTAADADFQYTSWRVFVAACGVPSLLVVLLLLPFPESPRYLLHANRAEQALHVLRRIFVVNTKLDAKDFPVTVLHYLPGTCLRRGRPACSITLIFL